MKELTIIDELKNLLPPLTDTEFTGLEEDILEKGVLCPLITWNDILIDGHHRYEICRKHQIPFQVNNIIFGSFNDAKIWIGKNQENRRNLTDFQRAEIALKLKDAIAAKAKERQRAAGGDKTNGQEKALLLKSVKAVNTQKELAEIADVSPDTITKTEFILKHADDETKSKLRRGEKGTSINKEYKRLKPQKSVTESASPESYEDFAVPMGLYCRPGEKPGASGKYYVPKSSLKDLPHDQPEVLVAQLMAHFPRDYTRKIPYLIFDALRDNDGNTVTKQLAGEIWHEFGKK